MDTFMPRYGEQKAFWVKRQRPKPKRKGLKKGIFVFIFSLIYCAALTAQTSGIYYQKIGKVKPRI